MKQLNILLVLFFTVIISAGVFATVNTVQSPFDLNVGSSTDLRTVEASVSYTGGSDFNAICFSTSDGNDDTSCLYMDAPGSPYTIDLNSDIVNGISSNTTEGNYTIYAVIKVDDGNFSATLSDDVNIDSSAPTLSASYPTNSGDYNVTSFSVDINVLDTYSGLDTGNAVIKLDGVTKSPSVSAISGGGSFTFTASSLSEGDHNITYDVNDDFEHNLSGTINFTVDTTAPSGLSLSTSTSWTNDEEPDFTLSATESGSGLSQAGFSCENDGPWHIITYASTITTFNITATSYDCNSDDGNKSIYAKFKDAAGNWSASASTNVKYDNNAPNAPTSLGATAGDTQVALSWTAPAADGVSGNAGYKIYKNGTNVATTTSTSKTITGLTNGTAYTFKVKAYDNAGNESSYSSEVSSTPTAGDNDSSNGNTSSSSDVTGDVEVKVDGTIVEYAKTGDTLSIAADFSANIDSFRIRVKEYDPTANTTTLEGPEDDSDSMSATYEMDGEHGKVCFWADGNDQDGDGTSTETDCVYLDDEDPEISWDTAPVDLEGKVTVKVEATDNQTIEKVVFYLGDTQADVADEDGNLYTGTVDSTKFDNGTYTLKAKVTDGAGNTNEVTKTVTIYNYISPEDMAQNAIDDAQEAKTIVEDLMDYFAEEGVIFPASQLADKKVADALLVEAKDLKTDEPEVSKARAESAQAKYESINTTAKFEEVPDKVAVYEIPTELDAALSAIGLSDAQRLEAIGIIGESGIERKLIIVKIGDDENAVYQAKVEITFTNTTDSSELKIIENIPKELVLSASEIFSDFNYIILQDDPVIEFVIDVASGASTTITYGIGGMTQAEAEALITNNVIASFASPPVILAATTDTSNLGSATDWTMIISYSLAVIVLVVVVGLIIFLSLKQEDNPFGGKGGTSVMSKINSKLSSLGKKDSGNDKKWAYKK